MKKGVNCWVSLFAETLVLLFLGLLYAWSIFKAPFNEVFESWTLSRLSMTFTISMTFFCLGAFFAGNLAKKISVRKILWLAAVMLFCGFVGVSTLNPENPTASLYLLYVLYGVLCGCGVGMGYNVVISTVNKAFTDRAGLASGIMLLGFGFGGIVLGSVASSMIESMGLFAAFRVLGIVIAVVLVVGALFMNPAIPSSCSALSSAAETAEAERELSGAGNEAVSAAAEKEPVSYTAMEMIRQPAFWIFVIWTVLLNSASLLVINSAATIAVSFGMPAVLGLIVSIFNGLGRVVHGAFFDRYKEKKSILLNNGFVILAGLCLTLGAFTNAAALILAGLIFSGLGYGGTPTLGSAVVMKRFGPKNFAVNFSIANFSLIPAAVIGPMISSKLIERAGGAYDSTFIMIIVLAAAALVLRTFLREER